MWVAQNVGARFERESGTVVRVLWSMGPTGRWINNIQTKLDNIQLIINLLLETQNTDLAFLGISL
ncbi:hypothetical protein GCM10008994_21450 [Halorubrum ejinorense]|uniref:Uncharacterized protein n=1 Tax=Halorubrum ejinorense TaxID=425309 RepID=A0AAV3SSU2_9EURY